MFKHLKKRFLALESTILNTKQISGKSLKLIEDEMALQQLLKLFDDGMFIPITQWSLSPREVLHICNDITVNKRKSVIEFGTGFSSICLAQLLKITNASSKLLCVESDLEWAKTITSLVKSFALEHYIEILYAPITDVPLEIAWQGSAKWYDTSILELSIKNKERFDLIIVDGPVGFMTPFSRYPALPFLREHLANDFAVFLDDTYRTEEQKISKKWSAMFDLTPVSNGRYDYLHTSNSFISEPFGAKKFLY